MRERRFKDLEIKLLTTDPNGETFHLDFARGTCSLIISGIWAGKVKGQYAYDDRHADGWHDTAGGETTGNTPNYVEQVDTIPDKVQYVRIKCTGNITQGTPPLRGRIVWDEG